MAMTMAMMTPMAECCIELQLVDESMLDNRLQLSARNVRSIGMANESTQCAINASVPQVVILCWYIRPFFSSQSWFLFSSSVDRSGLGDGRPLHSIPLQCCLWPFFSAKFFGSWPNCHPPTHSLTHDNHT